MTTSDSQLPDSSSGDAPSDAATRDVAANAAAAHETGTAPPTQTAAIDLPPGNPPADAPRPAPQSPRIRIGSQRPVYRPPGPLLTAAAPAPPQPKPVAPAELRLAEPALEESLPPASHDPAAAPLTAPPRKEPRSGWPATAPARPAPVEKVPLPNVRAELSPDLQLELTEALGDAPLDEMLSGAAGTPQDAEFEPETRLTARVVMVHRDSVFLDLGGRRQGVLKVITFATPPEPGAMLDVTVARFNADEGLYELGLPGAAVAVDDWSQISEGMVVDARVTGHNTGGLECEVQHLHGFIPASQISLYRVENLAEFVDQKFLCVVTEVNPERRRLVLSRRAVLERERAEARENLLAQLKVGQVVEGTVRSLREFGAFVDLGGIDGLIHISQLSWDRVKHASEVLQEGQKVKVKIQKIDEATGKIGLAFRDLSESPWSGAAQRYPTRSKVTGTVTRVTEFGAFVKLEPGIEGLIHISELSHKRVWRVEDIVQEGQTVEVLIQSVDAEQQRISLSLKALEARPMPVKKEDPEPDDAAPAVPVPSKRSKPLKGGIGSSSGGEQFGLKW